MTIHRVTDRGSNAPENIERAVQVIGRSRVKRAVFESVYSGRKQSKTVDEIADETGEGRQQVLNAAIRLAQQGLIHQETRGRLAVYRRDEFFMANRAEVLRYLNNPKKLEKLPTKRRPAGNRGSMSVRVSVPRSHARARHVTVDDIDSFRKVRSIDFNGPFTPIPEEEFKRGVARILRIPGRFKDWGGELCDLFGTSLRVDGRRRVVAFAFKGPGQKGRLTPGRMGKNGDQIQRLAQCPAEVYLVQYWNQIDPGVLKQLEQFVQLKSFLENRVLWYGIIDGQDSNRLMAAYPEAFPNYEFE